MRVRHLNCISTCPLGGSLMDGRSVSLLNWRAFDQPESRPQNLVEAR